MGVLGEFLNGFLFGDAEPMAGTDATDNGTPATDPNAPPAPAPADPVTPTPVIVGDLVVAEDTARQKLADAQAAAQAARQGVLDATDAEAGASAALGNAVNALGGVGIVNPDGSIRVLLSDGSGKYHPVTVAGVSAAVPQS